MNGKPEDLWLNPSSVPQAQQINPYQLPNTQTIAHINMYLFWFIWRGMKTKINNVHDIEDHNFYKLNIKSSIMTEWDWVYTTHTPYHM